MLERDVLIESPSEISTGEGRPPTPHAAPDKVAAGVPAVLSTMRYTAKEPGMLRGVSTLLRANQDGGVDCPSCAWPDPENRSLFEFCENGAKALADETTQKRIGPAFFQQYSVEELSRRSDWWLNNQGRITHPMYLGPDQVHYRPITWEDAFLKIQDVIDASKSAQRLVFYTSGRASNEAAFLYGTLVRMLGTNNLPDCSNMCHESSGSALGKTIGIGKGTVKLEDFPESDLILVVGQNPGTNHPRMLSALEQAKKAGSSIVSVNPLAEAGLSQFKNPQDFLNPLKAVGTLLGDGTQLADSHLAVRVGGDLALFKGVCKALVEQHEQDGRSVDETFIKQKTVGYEELVEALKNQDWETLERSSGVAKQEMTNLAQKAAKTDRIIICWAMGVTQHTNSVDTITQLVNLLLLRGAFGKPGAGACPVRGHSNVQGDRTVGINHTPKPEFLKSLKKEFGFNPPKKHGFDVAQAIEAMDESKVDLFVSLGGNFLSATPDTYKVATGLGKCKLTVSVCTKLNRSHLVTGQEALILPCLGRTEVDQQATGPQFVTVENSMGKVHRSRGTLPPPSEEVRSEVAILCGLGQILTPDLAPRWREFQADYSKIRDAISRVIPGFEDFNLRVARQNGFYLPNGPRDGNFTTPDGKAHFTVAQVESEELAEDQFILMTLRSHDQFNTVVYGYDDRYRGIEKSRRIVFINPRDLEKHGLTAGQNVSLVSEYNKVERRVDDFRLVGYPIPVGCLAAYFPEANPLVPVELRDPESGCPASKRIIVKFVTE